eukprot:TRINITY_DN3314_c0_g1_i3.p1 TRINITY_DN3314_c0_g1~~TRINITY_DN3314_c0_g1_i3.p1  ORF type:complete len:199 (+),score=23.78 TRINITY_DN3314_c0_g1_i3:147-743(+)
MLRSLVGSEMCIRDRFQSFFGGAPRRRRQGQQQGPQGPANPLAGFMQLLPLILILLMSLGGNVMTSGNGYEEEKMFSFGRNREFRHEMETNSGTTFFVKRDYFHEVQNSVNTRQNLYHKVDQQYEVHLARECENERHQKAHMEGMADELNDASAAQTAREYQPTSCDIYRQKYGRAPSQRYRQGSRSGSQRSSYHRGW